MTRPSTRDRSIENDAGESTASLVITQLLVGLAVATALLTGDAGDSTVWAALTVAAWVLPATVGLALALRRWRERMPRRLMALAVPAAVMALGWPIAAEGWSRLASEPGRPHEAIVVDSFRNLTFVIGMGAALGVPRLPVAPASLFLAALAFAADPSQGSFFLLIAYVVAGVFWLVTHHLAGQLGSSPRRRPAIPLLQTAAVGMVLLAAGLVGGLGVDGTAVVLAELVGSSGGTQWRHPNATSGVHDGDDVVRGLDQAQSDGADSDRFLDSPDPTLFDVFTDLYGEPFKPKQQQRAVALLSNQVIGEERQAKSHGANREFSVNRTPATRRRRPRDREAEALLYVRGSTPAHLPLTAFDRFDGVVWRESTSGSSEATLFAEPGEWHRIIRANEFGMTGVVRRQIKIGLLNSRALPLPSHPARFRLGPIKDSNFFNLAHETIWRLADPTGRLPRGEILEVESTTVDPEALREVAFPASRAYALPALRTPVEGQPLPAPIDALAEEWVRGIPRGWRQVEAIVKRLRSEYRHDREARSGAPGMTPDLLDDDRVAAFLLEDRRGPDYLFATSACVLLRTLGYPARLVSGFYVNPKRYDPRTRSTPVIDEDVHFWVEVMIPGGGWVAIEPTPGYELAPPVATWRQWLGRIVAACTAWIDEHHAACRLALLLLAAAFVARYRIANGWATLWWYAHRWARPQTLVFQTARLLDRRLRWAKLARPPSRTMRQWLRRVPFPHPASAASAIEAFVPRLEQFAYAPCVRRPLEAPAQDEVRRACLQVVRTLTLDALRGAQRAWDRDTRSTRPMTCVNIDGRRFWTPFRREGNVVTRA